MRLYSYDMVCKTSPFRKARNTRFAYGILENEPIYLPLQTGILAFHFAAIFNKSAWKHSKTAGINLTDYREFLTPDPRGEDAQRNHTVIPGDMLEGSTLTDTKKWLKGAKVDLFFMRMIGGADGLSKNPKDLVPAANAWYQLLSEGGLAFIAVPFPWGEMLPEWRENITRHYRGQIEVQATPRHVRLRKLRNEPENLPFLPKYRSMG